MKAKVISFLLIFAMCINFTYVSANETIQDEKVVYVDGVGYSVSIDENYNITLQSIDSDYNAKMVLDNTLSGDIRIDNGNEVEKYKINICDLGSSDNIGAEDFEYDDIDIEISDEQGNVVEEYDNIDDVILDEYEGQAAIAAGGTIAVGGLVTVLLKLAVAVCIAGVVCYAVDAVIDQVKKNRNYCYKAYRALNSVFINPRAISYKSAVSRIKNGSDVYTYTKGTAKSIMVSTAQGYYGPENHWAWYKIGLFFNHYHLNSHKKGKNDAHMFYGLPK